MLSMAPLPSTRLCMGDSTTDGSGAPLFPIPEMTTTTINESLRDFQKHGLRSVADLRALIHLASAGHDTATNLAAAAGVAPATCTQMIDRLHAAGLILRYNTADDRRIILTKITKAGRKLITPLLP